MPDKPMSVDANAFINFMRAYKHKYPQYEHISRKIFYPYISPYYQQWKQFYEQNYKTTKANEIKSIREYIKKV